MFEVMTSSPITASTPSGPTTPATQSGTTNPSGSWEIVPGILVVKWDYDPATNEVDVSANYLWWTIESLKGTLTKTEASLSDILNLINVVKGTLTIQAAFGAVAGGDAPGLWISGELDVFSKHWSFKSRLLSW